MFSAAREHSIGFCKIEPERVIANNELCFAIRDGHPVSPHHTLIIPKRHVANLFELYQPELNAAHALLRVMEAEIRSIDQQVTGFNVGINVGQDADIAGGNDANIAGQFAIDNLKVYNVAVTDFSDRFVESIPEPASGCLALVAMVFLAALRAKRS